MLVLPGIGFSDMRGSVGGVTAFRNRAGLVLRARVKPVNPNSDRQVAARTIMAFLAEQWREAPMTAAIRLAWETYAGSFNWTNALGQAMSLTGFNAFTMGNAAKMAAGGSLVTAAPTTLGLPAQDPLFTVSISAATQIITVTFDDTFEWVDEDESWLSVQMHEPKSASINFFGGPWRQAGAIEGDSTTPPTTPDSTTITAPYTATEGQATVCRARIIRSDGRTSTQFEAARILILA